MDVPFASSFANSSLGLKSFVALHAEYYAERDFFKQHRLYEPRRECIESVSDKGFGMFNNFVPKVVLNELYYKLVIALGTPKKWEPMSGGLLFDKEDLVSQ